MGAAKAIQYGTKPFAQPLHSVRRQSRSLAFREIWSLRCRANPCSTGPLRSPCILPGNGEKSGAKFRVEAVRSEIVTRDKKTRGMSDNNVTALELASPVFAPIS